LDEVREALAAGDIKALPRKWAICFSPWSIWRGSCNVDAEEALRQGNEKFERRFSLIEPHMGRRG